MKKMKSNLDERQELNLLKIEHNGCWLAFWGLLIVLVVQMVLTPDNPKAMAGEWIVFMAMALYLSVACMKNGIWDRKIRPTVKNNLLMSAAAGLVVGILFFAISYVRYHHLIGSLATAVFMFFFVDMLCFGALMLSATIYRKRLDKMENEIDEE